MSRTPRTDTPFRPPGSIRLLGEALRIDLIPSRKGKAVMMSGDHADVLFPPDGTHNDWERLLDEFMRRRLELALAPMVRQWEERLKVRASGFGLKRMRTRWGTCSISRRFIWFSMMLAEKPPRLVEYIVLHELCHLLEPSHNARFKFLLSCNMPDWKARERELNGR